MIIRYTSYGKRELLLLGCINLLLILSLWLLFPGVDGIVKLLLSAAVGVFGLILSLFFRNPHRIIPEGEDLLLAPADGVIVDIQEITMEDDRYFGNERVLRLGIFLSVYNVHINRAPCTFTVRDIIYTRGKYLSARNPASSEKNESNTVYGAAQLNGETVPLAVKQISGAVARRIVCETLPGETLPGGQAFGMIKFGSRTELFIPLRNIRDVCIAPGEKVKAGVSPLAVLKIKEK